MNDVHSFTAQFPKKRILVIGDVMLDEYIEGQAERISPEAPIPVLLETSVTHILGGAGNVAGNVASLGGKATLMGIVGNDADAPILGKLCKSRKIDTKFIVDVSRPTTKKMRFVANGHQLVRIDKESAAAMSEKVEAHLINAIKKLPAYDMVIVSDYAKGCITERVLAALAKRFGADKIVADMKPAHAGWYKGIRAITPNLKETFDMTGIRAHTDEDATKAAKMLAKRMQTLVILTRGEFGITVCESTKAPCKHFRSTVLTVKDVTGAGDTLIAVLALMIASGAPLIDAAGFANLAAGAVVGVAGTHALTRAELEEYIVQER